MASTAGAILRRMGERDNDRLHAMFPEPPKAKPQPKQRIRRGPVAEIDEPSETTVMRWCERCGDEQPIVRSTWAGRLGTCVVCHGKVETDAIIIRHINRVESEPDD
jgi:hypothetical protein